MEYLEKDAIIVDNHRLMLTRVWGEPGQAPKPLTVVGLNPSDADAEQDDPTIRRVVDFANRWGFNTLFMANLFTFRTPSPKALWKAEESIVHPASLQCALNAMRMSKMLLLAWGTGVDAKVIMKYDAVIKAYATAFESALVTGCKGPMCLGLNKDGSPVHPLYQPSSAEPKQFVFEGWKPFMEVTRGL